MLPVSLDCSCFITLSVFYNIYLSCVLSTLCCQFLWIVHVLLPFRYSITFICPVSCLLYVASFSGLFMFYVFSNVYLSCVLCTLCCQYLSCVLSTLCYQFLWFVHVLLPFRYSITFICPVSCLPYAASFSGLFMFYYPFGIL